MKTINDQFKQLSDLQKQSLAPFHKMNAVAAEAFERVARQNYLLAGDVVDYTVAQVQVPVSGENPQAIIKKQMVNTRNFAEKISSRAGEYRDLVSELSQLASTTARDSVEPVAELANKVLEDAQAQAAENMEQFQSKLNGMVEDAEKAKTPAKKASKRKPAARKKTPAKKASGKTTAKKAASRRKAAPKKRASKA